MQRQPEKDHDGNYHPLTEEEVSTVTGIRTPQGACPVHKDEDDSVFYSMGELCVDGGTSDQSLCDKKCGALTPNQKMDNFNAFQTSAKADPANWITVDM